MEENKLYLGVEIGGTKLQLAIGDETGRLVEKGRYTINAGGGADAIRQQMTAGLNELAHLNGVTAIGVGFGGPVDYQQGIICTSHQVQGWKDFNLVEWLQHHTGKPTVIENDANTAALAEAIHGSGRGNERVFYMTIGSGIGGGFVVNGKVYHGRTPGEVEVGHLRLNKTGETVEELCSGWAVNKKVKAAIQQQADGLLAQLANHHPGPEALLLKPALEQADKAAQTIVNEVADDLAFALSHVVHLFHPDLLVIGGGLSLLGEHLLLPLRERLPHYVMTAFLPPPEIALAALGEDVVPIGAIELARLASGPKNQTSTKRDSL
jgi:glucokinase